jgi:hypothetical protein
VELPLSVDIEHLLLTFDILNGDDPADRKNQVAVNSAKQMQVLR